MIGSSDSARASRAICGALLALMALFAPAAAASAQAAPDPTPAMRLRTGFAADPLRPETDSPSAAEPVVPRIRIERRTLAGGAAGLVLGAAAGAAAGCHFNRDDYGVFCGGQSDTTVFIGAALGAAAGTALGMWLFGR